MAQSSRRRNVTGDSRYTKGKNKLAPLDERLKIMQNRMPGESLTQTSARMKRNTREAAANGALPLSDKALRRLEKMNRPVRDPIENVNSTLVQGAKVWPSQRSLALQADRARANAEMDPQLALGHTVQGRKILYREKRMERAKELRAQRAARKPKEVQFGQRIISPGGDDILRTNANAKSKGKFDAIRDYDKVSLKDARAEFDNDAREMEHYDTYGAGRHGDGEGVGYLSFGGGGGKDQPRVPAGDPKGGQWTKK